MLSIISFTEKGAHLSLKLLDMLSEEGENAWLYTKCSKYRDGSINKRLRYVYSNTDEWAKVQMSAKNGLLFIGACGIAVRAIAPWVVNKLYDSPVLVMDELGTYVIPILSGHVGGANEIAVKIAEMTGSIPVITTATDLNKSFAVDIFAKKNYLYIENKNGIAKVSSKVLRGEKINIAIESHGYGHDSRFANQIKIVDFPPKQPVDVIITTGNCGYNADLVLRPREYVLGMGCKRDKEPEKIAGYIDQTLTALGISKNQVYAICSIDKKRDEAGFLQWSSLERIPFITYSAEELEDVEGDFEVSQFVKSQVGVDNVCERAALKGCGEGGELVYRKHASDGMTIAVAKRDWRVSFDYE
ncbi:MAG: cobalamin biosynthesis protein [Lachnobacterium sp.]|nr:cobalamin biosynthesis protein [Lachnobacterium sp.]MDD6633378.1 cobalamin biosynthesis protein [Lachnobacterium sp.]MDY2911012.1 cobalamin biosynthesis protein [Agathobacter sp.]